MCRFMHFWYFDELNMKLPNEDVPRMGAFRVIIQASGKGRIAATRAPSSAVDAGETLSRCWALAPAVAAAVCFVVLFRSVLRCIV